MHGYFLFPCSLPTRPDERALVIFCSTTTPDVDDFEEQLREYCDQNTPPDRIHVIGSQAEQESILHAVESHEFVNRLPSVTRHLDTPNVETLFFGLDGLTDAEDDAFHIRRLGMTHIFRHRQALLEATSAHHYVKPSDRHCDKFLRTANALVDGAEIDFIAFCCLPHLNPHLAHFYCDTGAISPIAYALVALGKRLDPDSPWATVDSFGSYEGMRRFQFREMHKSMVLISASTSGGLAKGMMEVEPGITHDRLATVFYLGETPEHGHIVCDLRYDVSGNPEGYDPLVSFAGHECRLCSEGSTAIPIAGDHFLPEGIRVDPVIIRASDAPNWLESMVRDVMGTGFLRVNYKVPNTTGATKDVFLDLQALFASGQLLEIDRFRRRFQRMVDHGASASVRRILHLDDNGSRQMANAIHKMAQLSTEVQVIPLRTVEQNLNDHVLNEGLTIVAAGAVASGSSLLAVSQALRHVQTNGSVNYMIGVARTPDQATLRDVRGHVTYGEQPDEHGFHLMDRVFLPMYRAGRSTPWDQERALLLRLIESANHDQMIAALENRRSEIDAGASSEVRGLTDTVFLCRSNGNPLELRPGFAFFNFDYEGGDVSQAEVYFTISAILHQMRQRSDSHHSFTQHGHVRKVISPRCFERFNDGVIQAAILRAAFPAELDYSLSDQLNTQMEQVLRFIFSNAANESGEGATEFVLALALKILRLSPESVSRLKNEFRASDDVLSAALWSAVEA